MTALIDVLKSTLYGLNIYGENMGDEIKKQAFSFVGVSLLVGVTGFLSSIVTIFINIESQVSVKWIILVVLFAMTVVLLLLKVIHDLWEKAEKPPGYAIPIKSDAPTGILVIKKNENFTNNIFVGCYLIQDEIERLAYIGVVHHVQDKLIQIRLVKDAGVFKKSPYETESLKLFIIRPVLPISAFPELSSIEYIQ